MKNSVKLFLLVAIPLAGIAGYMLMTDKLMVRLPVLVHEDPKITFVTGNVHYREEGDDKWNIAIVGEKLSMGDEIRTKKDSLIDIRFTSKMAIRITSDSLVKLDSLTIKKMLLNVKKGSMYGKFEKIYKNHNIRVTTPTVVASVRGTELGFSVMERLEEPEAEKKNEEKDKKKKDKSTAKKEEDTAEEPETKFSTSVYSLSGITEVKNPEISGKNVLLANQNRVVVDQGNAPGDVEELSEEELLKLRSILNSIHSEEVLLITDKISFKVGSAEILKSSYPELDKIYKVLLERDVVIRIEGHTDDKGSDSDNQELSLKRAEAIKNYFYSKGIQMEQLQVVGYGESRPIASNKSKEGRAKNRRVEFIIVDE
jgi:outer membrane protein OmpA-like peptidoglycan-associated protein